MSELVVIRIWFNLKATKNNKNEKMKMMMMMRTKKKTERLTLFKQAAV